MDKHPHYFSVLCHRLPSIQQRQLRGLLEQQVITNEVVSTILTPEQQSIWRQPPIQLKRQIESDLAWLDAHGAHLVRYGDDKYPALLLEIADPPPLLYVLGDISLLATPQIAMVGSRRPSRGGSENAYRFAKALAELGWTVTSGMALGIDAQAHQGSLDAHGKTIAVLGTGLDIPYPRRHNELYERIAEYGAIVSEWPLGSPPLAGHFPRRNRIISGLSLGVLVVEAALQSGSLVTARLALEQNREVFAIPGSIHNPVVKGCHQLIRQGAKLVETVEHIQEELSGWLAPTYSQSIINNDFAVAEDLTESEKKLFELIGFEPISIDEVASLTNQPIGCVLADVTNLLIKGVIDEQEGRYWRLR